MNEHTSNLHYRSSRQRNSDRFFSIILPKMLKDFGLEKLVMECPDKVQDTERKEEQK